MPQRITTTMTPNDTILEHLVRGVESVNKWNAAWLVLLGVIVWIRKMIVGFCKSILFFYTFPEEWKDDRVTIKSTAEDVAGIKAVIGYNGGGGLMDKVSRIESHTEDTFFHRRQPAFECDGEGKNSFVSHAYCLLVGVSTCSDLDKSQWRNFVNSKEVDAYHGRFMQAATNRTQTFRDEVELLNYRMESRGRWRIVARFLGDPAKSNVIRYLGNLYPADETAKKIAAQYGWDSIE